MDNLSIFFFISGFSNHSQILDNLMIFTTKYLIFITLLLMLVLSVKGKLPEKKALLLSILAVPIAILLIMITHIFINEPRPFVTYHFIPLTDNKPDLSFPSRHATIMAVFAFAYIFCKSKWAPFFILLMIWVGLSRIYVGVHYPLDILGGFIVGIISLTIALATLKFLKTDLIS